MNALPSRHLRSLSALGLAFWVGCAPSAPQPDAPSATLAPSVAPVAAASSAPPAVSSSPAPTPAASVAPASDAGSETAAVVDAGADPAPPIEAAPPFAADNKLPPTEGPELQARAKGLLEAVIHDDPALADPFWFPKEPFIPLKDVKGPDKYWEQLHRTYGNDVHALHKKRSSWSGAVFEKFEIGSNPKWVKPGDEANKIGYHRSFHGKLRYTVDGQSETIDVHTVITWQGRWYVTHLRKFKK